MLRKSFSAFVSGSKVLTKSYLKSQVNRCTASAHGYSTSQEEESQFDIRKDGKRLKGSEFSELVFSQITGEEKSQIPRSAFEVLAKEYDEVTTEGNDFREKYQRSLAETENVRRRGIKQTEDAKVFAIQGFCKDLLEVADILEMAVNSVKAEELEKGGKTLKDLHDGVSMTRTVLLKTFTKHGLVPVNPVNEKFDPNLHEAVFQIPPANAKQQPGFVEVVTKIGFNLKDRPIRPAQVGVVAPQ